VITGIGVVTPIGIGKSEFWKNALAGKSGIREIQCIDTSSYRVHRGGEVWDFDASAYLRHIDPSEVGRCSQLAIAATRLALLDADIAPETVPADRVGVSIGTTMGEPQVLEKLDEQWLQQGIRNVSRELVQRYPCNVICANIAREFGFAGPNLMFAAACAAGNYAIGHAADQIRLRRADIMVAGGADCFSRIAFTGFARLAAIAPERCQPFTRDRKGMMVSEGAGALILETFKHASSRNAKIYAEILGCGLACDAFHMTGSHPEGRGMISAMRKALQQSGISPEEVGYISAHGTGTPTNDRMETLAIRHVLGKHAYSVPVSSIKSMIGHTMGAASAIEAAVCALAVRYYAIPPTINYDGCDPECDLDYVPNVAREKPVRAALSNSFAFGGLNAVIALKRV